MHHLSVSAAAGWVDALLLDGPGEAPCLRFGEPVTRGGFREMVVDAQRALAGQGVGPGASVALSLPPSVGLVTHLLACLRSGAQTTVIDPRLTGPEKKAVLASVRPRLMLWADHGPAPLRGFHDVDVRAERLPGGRPAETDHALVQVSSGSTGTPKRIGRTADGIRREIESLAEVQGMPRAGERVVVLNSLVHSMGLLTGILYDLYARAEIVVPPTTTARGIMDTLAGEHAPTTVFGVPFHVDLLSSVSEPPPLPSLRAVATAGEVPAEGLARAFGERYGLSLGNLYGMTEVGLIAVDPLGRAHPSAGRPLPGTRVRTEAGELLVSCPADPYLEGGSGRWADGWLRTRDAGAVGPGGEVTVLGRLDSQVSVGGLKVDLTEVEHRLAALPGVTGAVVLFDSGIEAFAEVGEGVTARGLEEGLARTLAPYKRPARVHTTPRLPRTSSGKPLRDIRRLKNPPEGAQ
ncbi:p-hydroxybenzoic acid--AMP ligase FadD22 [Nocardiopsis dassonvillei]|uniref:class I adenylate-forming enzyme family protein n=1 Tax=Nocardiopsis dassonvillei TaxID=2014 RepID=UPI003F552F41